MTQVENGIGDKAAALAEKLTAYPNSDIFKHDNEKYYSNGEVFKELDGIRDRKLLPALEAQKLEANLTKEQDTVIKKADEILTKAEESLTSKKPEIQKIPLARLVEAANQYYAAGERDSGDILVKYAIQQAELIEKPKLKSPGEEGPITTQLNEFKAAVDEHYKEQKKAQNKSDYKGAAIDPKLESLIAASGNVKLEKGTNSSIPNLKAGQISIT